MIKSRNVDLLRRRLYIPVLGMNGYSVDTLITGGQGAGDALQQLSAVIGKTAASNVQAVGAVAGTDRNVRLRSIGNGNPRIVPVVGLNMSGLLVASANDGVEFSMMIPSDLDRLQAVGARCVWTSEAAAVGARDITWRIRYGRQAVAAALAAGATALDTTITAQAPTGTSLAIERGNRGVINANTFASTDFFVSLEVLMTAFNGAFTENKYLLGVELDYVPRLTAGSRKATAGLTTDLL